MTQPVMRAARFVGDGRIELCEKPVPQPGPGQLLLRVEVNALCGSERGQFHNGAPVTPGHEAVGTVHQAGEGTTTPVGTRGAVYLMDFCGRCRSCAAGHTNQCLAKRADYGFNRDGGYAEFELVSESVFFPVPATLGAAEATLLLDIMGTGGHAIRRAQAVRPDIRSVLVAGAGPIGLGVLAMSRLLLGDSGPVIVTDMTAWRLELAAKAGGIAVDLRSETAADAIRRAGLENVDIAIDTSGQSTARRECLSALGSRGVLVCVGHGQNLDVQVSPDLIAPERAILGSEYFRFDELPANLALLTARPDAVNWVITHTFPLEQIVSAFETFFAGATGKVIVEPWKI